MLALSDSQLRAVWAAADGLPAEKRGIFLGRLVARFQFLNGDTKLCCQFFVGHAALRILAATSFNHFSWLWLGHVRDEAMFFKKLTSLSRNAASKRAWPSSSTTEGQNLHSPAASRCGGALFESACPP